MSHTDSGRVLVGTGYSHTLYQLAKKAGCQEDSVGGIKGLYFKGYLIIKPERIP